VAQTVESGFVSGQGDTVRAKKAKTLESDVLFKGRVFSVRRDRVVEPDGLVATRDIISHPGSVVVLPVFPDGTALLVRQYRHAVDNYLWELVAGALNPGESPAAGARRELAEEAGYAPRRLRKLLEIFPSPGFISERMWIFLATNLTRGVARPEQDERITARRFSLAAIQRMIRSGAIRDGKSIAGILFYLQFVR
jgi:ADP-ribose pyrophosphatase